jgi:hypothetical protein
MNEGFHQFAEALIFVHGPYAESEAARHARLCERIGDGNTANTWRKLQIAVRQMTAQPVRSAA